MDKLLVAKIGGSIIDDERALKEVLERFAAVPHRKVLVHGGGRRADRVLERMDIEPRMVRGRRITDAPTLEVVQMVYAGLVNKNIVALLQSTGCAALGLSGADLDCIRAVKRPKGEVNFGFVGDIELVNTRVVRNILDAGWTPVFCPLTHDGRGQMLNTNADTIAVEIAIALEHFFNVELVFCSGGRGVLADPGDEQSVLARIGIEEYHSLKARGIISAGMIPKLDTAFRAMRNGVTEIRIGGSGALNAENQATRLCLSNTEEKK